MSLKNEPASEPLHIYVKELFFNEGPSPLPQTSSLSVPFLPQNELSLSIDFLRKPISPTHTEGYQGFVAVEMWGVTKFASHKALNFVATFNKRVVLNRADSLDQFRLTLQVTETRASTSFFSLLLSSLELSDTKVYEP